MNRPTPTCTTITRRWPRVAAALTVPVIALTACSTDERAGSASLETAASEVGERAQRTATALEQAGLGTLASAVRQVDMDEVVTEGDFTLFAPNDEAFQSLTADELANLTSESDRLVAMLRAHTVEDVISADELRDTTQVTTVGGSTLEVSVEDGTVTVGDGKVLETVQLNNGAVAHVIDEMLARE